MLIEAVDLIDVDGLGAASAMTVADLGPAAGQALILGSCGQPNRVFLRHGDRLVPQPLTEIADPAGSACALAAADLDGDGVEEIWIANGGSDQADRLFKAVPAGFGNLLDSRAENTWTRLRGRAVLPMAHRKRAAFLVASDGEPLRLVTLGEAGALVDEAASVGLDEIVAARLLLCGPIVGAASAILAAAAVGPSALFTPSGRCCWREIGGEVGLDLPDLDGVDAALFDPAGSGALGLFCLRRRGEHLLYRQTPAGGLVDVCPPALSRPCPAVALVIADFDNDGREEIVILNDGEPNRLVGWREGGWRVIDPGAALEPGSRPTVAGALDIDGDGRLELLVARRSTAGSSLVCYRATGARYPWLRVLPRTPAGAPARGAIVRLRAGTSEQVRICGGAGAGRTRMEPVAHFGLGRAAKVDWIDVSWPDGAVYRLPEPDLCQTIEVAHPSIRGCEGTGRGGTGLVVPPRPDRPTRAV